MVAELPGSALTKGGMAEVQYFDMAEGDSDGADEYPVFAATPSAGPFSSAPQITTKVPPEYDGTRNWFAYEESIDDWIDITTLPLEKHGPSLKNRLYGDAAIYKPLLDRDLLCGPDDGVTYFKNAMRPHFVKGNQSVFFGGSTSFFGATEDRWTC